MSDNQNPSHQTTTNGHSETYVCDHGRSSNPCPVCFPVSQTTQERDAYWRALTEIAFSDFEAGPTPDYIREHALRVLKKEGLMAASEVGDWYEVRDVQTDRRGYMPTFDEIVTGPVDSIHIEQLTDQTYWIGIYKGDERLVVVFGSKNQRSHVTGRFERESA